jgi:endogenous inhibitor of DNA gyrase (YacG/DUF329 family)
MRTCPICKRQEVLPRLENPAFPFCSDRCKLLDLGKWLSEDYRIGGKPEEEDDDEQPEVPTRAPDDADA